MRNQNPIEYDQNWQETYGDLIATPREAVSLLKPGQRVFIGTGCAEPVELVEALTGRANDLADVEILQLLTKGDAPYASRKLIDSFTVNSFFIGKNIRGHIQEGLGNYTPCCRTSQGYFKPDNCPWTLP
jgi:acyl-CoA hydrolase